MSSSSWTRTQRTSRSRMTFLPRLPDGKKFAQVFELAKSIAGVVSSARALRSEDLVLPQDVPATPNPAPPDTRAASALADFKTKLANLSGALTPTRPTQGVARREFVRHRRILSIHRRCESAGPGHRNRQRDATASYSGNGSGTNGYRSHGRAVWEGLPLSAAVPAIGGRCCRARPGDSARAYTGELAERFHALDAAGRARPSCTGRLAEADALHRGAGTAACGVRTWRSCRFKLQRDGRHCLSLPNGLLRGWSHWPCSARSSLPPIKYGSACSSTTGPRSFQTKWRPRQSDFITTIREQRPGRRCCWRFRRARRRPGTSVLLPIF